MPILGAQGSTKGAPGVPTSVSATSPTSTTASVSFTVPSFSKLPITSYTVTSSPGSYTASGASSPITVSGLSAGTAYTFTVTATHANGTSFESTVSNSVTPVAPTFMNRLYTTGDEYANRITTDSSGNIYVAGYSYLSSEDRGGVQKFTSDGTLSWNKQLAYFESNSGKYRSDIKGIITESSGNVYVTGKQLVPAQVSTDALIVVKLDSNGTIIWEKKAHFTDGNGTYLQCTGYSLGLDSSNNVYVSGGADVGIDNQDASILKYNSSGTIQWSYRYSRPSPQGSGENFQNSAVDSSGNIYNTFSYYNYTATIGYWTVAKMNSSGAVTWARKFSDTNKVASSTGVTVDSSGNVVSVGSSNISGTYHIIVAQWNSSGTLQWQRQLASSSVSDNGSKVTTDSSNNIYVLGNANSTPGAAVVAKYDSSGTLQWQRSLIVSARYTSFTSIAISGSNLIISGQSTNTSPSSNADILLLQVPTDGSKTGTYTVGGLSYVYATSSLTSSTSSLTESSETLTQASITLVHNTADVTTTDLTWTSSTTSI